MEWIKIYKDKACWHFWFACFPVVVQEYPDKTKRYKWLCKVLRKGHPFDGEGCAIDWNYEYKDIPKELN